MNGDLIPDNDNVSRYCRASTVSEYGIPLPQAFQLRRGEDSLSVNWLEYLSSEDLVDALRLVRMAFQDIGYSLGRNGRFAVLNVGEIKDLGLENSISLLVRHDPQPNNVSHAGIFGFPNDDFLIATAIAQLVSQRDMHPAVT